MSIQSFPSLHMDPEQDRFSQKSKEIQKSLDRMEPGKENAEEAKKAAQEFESFFLYYMIKVMRDTIQVSELLGERKAEKVYRSMQDEQLAQVLAERGGLGLADMIQRDLGKNNHVEAMTSPDLQVQTGFPISGHHEDHPGLELTTEGRMTSGFGRRVHPVTGALAMHEGIDIAMPAGSPILAAGDGEVVFSGTMKGYGNVMILSHSEDLETVYAHNESNELPVGAKVQKGEVIGRVGMTGRATGPHLHFEVRESGIPVAPEKHLKAERH